MFSVGNNDLPSGAAMLYGVVHEIGDGIEDQIAIAGGQHLTVTDDGETGAILFGCGIVQLDNFTGDVDQVHIAEGILSSPGTQFEQSA